MELLTYSYLTKITRAHTLSQIESESNNLKESTSHRQNKRV